MTHWVFGRVTRTEDQTEREESDCVSHILHQHGAHLGDRYVSSAGRSCDPVRSQYLASMRFGRDARGKVHGCTEDIAVDLDRAALMEPSAKGGKLRVLAGLDEDLLDESRRPQADPAM